MLKGHLPRVIYHQVYWSTKNIRVNIRVTVLVTVRVTNAGPGACETLRRLSNLRALVTVLVIFV